MSYHYEVGAVRWRRHTQSCDVRAVHVQQGWTAFANLIDYHPITGKQLRRAQWWIRETYVGKSA